MTVKSPVPSLRASPPPEGMDQTVPPALKYKVLPSGDAVKLLTTPLAGAMRRVVTDGTARRVMAGSPVEMAGKTGTAQLDQGEPHAWFAGFAPYQGARDRRLAFAVIVEHGGYGGRVAAPIAREVMEAAKGLGLL